MPSSQNVGLGFTLPKTPATPSPAAAILRAAAVGATLSDLALSTQPRSSIDQGNVNCCVSCALGCAMEVIHPDWPALAPLFHYYVSRFINNSGDAAGGLTLDEALATLTNQGICRHADHNVDQGAPYTLSEVPVRPSPAAFADASNRRIPFNVFQFKYNHLSGPSWVVSIRDELRQQRPVAIGFRLPTGYPNGFLDARFEWTNMASPPLSTFGHCVLVTGYSDTRQALRVRDSQGTARFDSGSWWMGYRLADTGVIQDAYSLIP